MNEITHRSLPWCSRCVKFPTLGKKKGYIDEYGPKTLNSNKIVRFVCQNILTCAQINLSWFLLIKGWKVDRYYPIEERKNPWLWNKHEEGSNTWSMGMLGAPECPKNEDILGTFGCQEISKSSLGKWNYALKSSFVP